MRLGRARQTQADLGEVDSDEAGSGEVRQVGTAKEHIYYLLAGNDQITFLQGKQS